MRSPVLLALLSVAALSASGQRTSRWGFALEGAVGNVLKADAYEKMWLKKNGMWSVAFSARRQTLPKDSSTFAADYNYPTFSYGLLYHNFRNVRMHKEADPAWGMAVPVDYVSRMGDAVTAFATFERPVFRSGKLQTGYALSTGIGYATHTYDRYENVDNEILGSHWNIFFGASLYALWQIHPQWALRGAVDFRHLSNGASARPNKGANTVAPSLTLIYTPQPVSEKDFVRLPRRPYPKHFYADVAVGVGGKTLLDDWLLTSFSRPPSAPDYRTGHFHFYPSFSVQTNVMYRYARRWASGIGVDVNYAKAAKHIQSLDRATGSTLSHSPWSVGVAARHEAFYGRWSMAASLGVYLFRHMGETAQWEEKPYYERIGIRYHFRPRHGLFLGADVKAHLTKADFTEIVLGWHF